MEIFFFKLCFRAFSSSQPPLWFMSHTGLFSLTWFDKVLQRKALSGTSPHRRWDRLSDADSPALIRVCWFEGHCYLSSSGNSPWSVFHCSLLEIIRSIGNLLQLLKKRQEKTSVPGTDDVVVRKRKKWAKICDAKMWCANKLAWRFIQDDTNWKTQTHTLAASAHRVCKIHSQNCLEVKYDMLIALLLLFVNMAQ